MVTLPLLLLGTALGLLQQAPQQQASVRRQHKQRQHKLPTLGWVWHTDQYGNQYNESDVLRQAHALVSTGLASKGWDLVVVEDCWSECSQLTASGLNCAVPAPRGADGRIRPDRSRFPSGIAGIAKQVAALGLRVGIYTSMGNYTCAGYTGSWGHEATDAAAFAEWGVDFLMHDSCFFGDDNRTSSSLIRTATRAMRAGIDASANPSMHYYADTGNGLLLPRLYLGTAAEKTRFGPWWPEIDDTADATTLLPSHWAVGVVDELKMYFDLEPTFWSMIDNVHHVQGQRFLQSSGVDGSPAFYNSPDNHVRASITPRAATVLQLSCRDCRLRIVLVHCVLTTQCMLVLCAVAVWRSQIFMGMTNNFSPASGGYLLPLAEQQAQMTMWTILGSGMLLGADVATMPAAALKIVGNPDVLAIHQDSWGVQGSLVDNGGGYGGEMHICSSCELWIRPLSWGAALSVAEGGAENSGNSKHNDGDNDLARHSASSGQPRFAVAILNKGENNASNHVWWAPKASFPNHFFPAAFANARCGDTIMMLSVLLYQLTTSSLWS